MKTEAKAVMRMRTVTVSAAPSPGLFEDGRGDRGGGDVRRVGHAVPVDDTEGADLEEEVDRHDAEDGEDDGAGQGAARVLDFGTHVRRGVVAQVVVDADGQARGEADPEVAAGQLEGVRRVGEGQVGAEVGGRGDDHQDDRGDHDRPHDRRDAGDVFDASPEENDHQCDHAQADEVACRPAHVGGQVAEVLDEADHAGGHDQRDEEHGRPDEQERHQASGAVLEGLAEIHVAAAGAGHRRAQFRPDQAVREGEDGARDEADDRLRAAERGHHQRDRHERADAAHLAHVDGGGLEQADAADETAGGWRTTGHGAS